MSHLLRYTLYIITAIFLIPVAAWFISLPIRLFANIVFEIRRRRYDPEISVCRGCGYRGDKRSNNKTVELKFTRTRGPEKAAIKCTCFRCNTEYYLPLYRPAKEWLPEMQIEDLKKSL
jgi:hypothetical protein